MANQLKEELVLSTSKFDSNINNVIKKVEELKNKGSKVGGGFETSMGKMIQKATGFNGSMGSLIGVVGKFSGVLGGVITTGEFFNKMMEQSQTLGDEVARVQSQASEAVNYFASSMASADFGSFLDGLRNIITLAGEAADAMDRAASIGLRFGWTNQSQLGSYNRAMAQARNPENSKEERLKYLEEAKKLAATITKGESIKSKADLEAAFKTIRTELAKVKYNGEHVNVNKLTNQQIRDLFDVANFERYEKMHDEMQEALDGVVLINTKYGAHGAHLAKADQDKFARDNMRLAAYAANEINDDADSPLGQAVQMIGAVDLMLANQAERQTQLGKLANKIEGSTKTIKTNTKKGGGKTEIDYAIGSVGWLEQQIQQLKKEIKLQVDSSEIEKLTEQIKTLQLQLDYLQRPYKPINNALTGSKGVSPYTIPTIDQIKETKPSQQFNTLEDYFEQYSDRASEVLRKLDIGLIGSDLAKELIDSINAQLQALGLKPLEINIKTDAQQKLEGIAGQVEQLGSAFRGLGEGFELPALDIMGVIGQSIANVLLSYSEAMLKPKDPISWLTFGLMGLGEVAAIISQIHSLSGYANGGVIGGNSFAGDNLLVRANSGEMILNSFQQKHLFDMLDKGTTNTEMSNVHFVIRGRDLVGVFDNYNDKIRKVR